MQFKRNKNYFAELKEEKQDMWVAQSPLFIDGNKGLFPYFDTNNRHGLFSKNHKGLILAEIEKDGDVYIKKQSKKKEITWDI